VNPGLFDRVLAALVHPGRRVRQDDIDAGRTGSSFGATAGCLLAGNLFFLETYA